MWVDRRSRLSYVDEISAAPYSGRPAARGAHLMTKAELIDRIIRSKDLPTDLTKKCIAEVLDVAFAELGAYFVQSKIARGQPPRFTYPGFGTFTKKQRRARSGVHPQTLEKIVIEGFETLDFKPSAELKRSLNPGRARGSSPVVVDVEESESALAGPSGRRLVSREDVELDLTDGDALSLPDAPLQSTRARVRKSRARANSR